MDIATLLGLIGSFGIIFGAMVLGGSVIVFVNAPSMLIVLGGSIFAVLMKFTLQQFLSAIRIAGKAFKFKSVSPNDLISEVVTLADEARKGGLLSLEGKEVSHDFLQKGITLLVDGHDPEVVRSLLAKDMRQAAERHELGAKIFSQVGDVAPAMGMIGTLIGLVQMLSAMDDPKSIGPAMAVALLTTLYGAMIANMIALPIADKLTLRASEETTIQSMILDAIILIQSGQNPRVIQSTLQTYLPESQRNVEEP
ncbi:MAG: flagellar motor protein PomA [Gammaproteobacteria bacterium]